MRDLMPTYDALTTEQQELVREAANAARAVLFTHGLRPPWDDRAAVFDEACAVLLYQCEPVRTERAS